MLLISLLLSLPFGCVGDDDAGSDTEQQDSADTASEDSGTDDTGTDDTGSENTLPDAPTLYWSNVAPVAGVDAFSCLAEAAVDAEGDSLTLEVTWTQDGAPYTGATATDQFAGDTLPAEAATEAHLWGCTAAWNDGTGLSASSSIEVQSVAPSCSPEDVLPACHGANVEVDPLVGSTAGGVTVGIQLMAEEDIAVQGAQVFTGERTGGSTLEIWSHDASADAPGTKLAGGSWTIGEPLEWQGANFEESVAIASGETYWVVWHQLSRAHSSFGDASDPDSVNVPYRPSTDGGATWGDRFEGPFRVQVLCCE